MYNFEMVLFIRTQNNLSCTVVHQYQQCSGPPQRLCTLLIKATVHVNRHFRCVILHVNLIYINVSYIHFILFI